MTAGLSSNLAKVGQLDFPGFQTRQPDSRTISDLRIEGLSFLVLKKGPQGTCLSAFHCRNEACFCLLLNSGRDVRPVKQSIIPAD